MAMGAGLGGVLRLVMKSGLLLSAGGSHHRLGRCVRADSADRESALRGHSNRSLDIRERGDLVGSDAASGIGVGPPEWPC